MKMDSDSLNSHCYNMTEFERCNGTDHHDTKLSRSTGGNTGGGRRKMSRWDTTETPTRSTGSLLTTMEQFVQTVDDMNETILVPCRLMDAKFDSPPTTGRTHDPKTRLMANLNGVDLFQFYNIINSVKSDLMWGSKSQHPAAAPVGQNGGLPLSVCSSSSSFSVLTHQSSSATTSSNSIISSTGGSGEVKGHKRRPSTVSTTSSASVSDTEFSELNEDSGVEGEEEYSQHMADAFHHHLNGLQQCLRDLTLAANHVTTRYTNDLGGVFNL